MGGVAVVTHRLHGSRKFVGGGSNYDSFSVDKGGQRIHMTLKAGHHRPTSETPLNGVSLAGPMIARH